MPAMGADDLETMRTLEAVNRFNEAFNRHDVDGVMEAMTDDCVFENTCPPPDGERFEGTAAVRATWGRFFASSPNSRFAAEEIFAAGNRCVVRWRYDWVGMDGVPGHIRGVDLFRVSNGKVAEKLAYVKGWRAVFEIIEKKSPEYLTKKADLYNVCARFPSSQIKDLLLGKLASWLIRKWSS